MGGGESTAADDVTSNSKQQSATQFKFASSTEKDPMQLLKFTPISKKSKQSEVLSQSKHKSFKKDNQELHHIQKKVQFDSLEDDIEPEFEDEDEENEGEILSDMPRQ